MIESEHAALSASPHSVPDQLPVLGARYRVVHQIGRGGFGVVYLAQDGELHRKVAIKVPHAERIARADQVEAYRAEARAVAGLDHPNIVPVFDVSGNDEFPFFIVSKFVEGKTLAERLQDRRLDAVQAARLAAAVAEALDHAHRRGLVHRDIKPRNILVDGDNNPFIVDFGLALKDENVGLGPRFAGTPQYMSPEQARGEGHRVDGRSDLFSLGVVLYEILADRLPFRGATPDEVLEKVIRQDPRPLHQIDQTVPRELERICLKALSKRVVERYATGKEMAEDLRRFLEQAPQTPLPEPPRTAPSNRITPGSSSGSRPVATDSDSRIGQVVPKGLRSFDADDADFFLELLPGPRNRDGLPESLAFWKHLIEESDDAKTFAVGLIYGPSGCGKSSLVKAGLLPRLAQHVITIYVEATAEETESRLLHGLRKQIPGLAGDSSLKESLAALRRGQGLGSKKVLLVIDQFEQWLHARQEYANSELVQALRQCDGQRVQCIVMVRDDFWLSVSRFLQELEIHLMEGQNSALVDLFPIRHATRVLTAFGRAYGAITDSAAPSRSLDPQLQEFLKRLDQVGGSFRDIHEGVHKAIQVADLDSDMALTRVRKVLEFVVRDVYERKIKEPPGTRPLENLIQRISKDGHFPDRLDAYANTIRKLGNVGTHSFGEQLTAADVHHSLTLLMVILEWYFDEGVDSKASQPQPIATGSRIAPAVAAGASRDHLEQKQFLEQAVTGLAQNGKVICVRLALFAEMMKGKPWTPASLKEVGGTEGVGCTFLEETFSAATAPPEHRVHQRAARAVLNALLPETGADIKGHMRPSGELLQASGYAGRPQDFDHLIRILDNKLRLITPTDPEGRATEAASSSGEKYYQLTHDYLVPSLRDWLTRKQKETKRGRAELLLADRAAVWKDRPENRQLPSLPQWLGIRWNTRSAHWTRDERKWMKRAARYHLVRGLAFMMVLVLLGWGVFESRGRIKAHALRERLLDAGIADVPDVVQDLAPYRRWVDPLLRARLEQQASDPNDREEMRLRLGLLPVDPGQKEFLYPRLMESAPQDVVILKQSLAPYAPELTEKLWEELTHREKEADGRRLRAAFALAGYDPRNPRWAATSTDTANLMVAENPAFLGQWIEGFRNVKSHLMAPLAQIFRDRQRRDSERTLATSVIAEFASDEPLSLADLLMDADENAFLVLFPVFQQAGERGLTTVLEELQKEPSAGSDRESRVALAKRQANAAVILMRMNRPSLVWPQLRLTPNPAVRGFLIHRLGRMEVDWRVLLQRLEEEKDVSIQRALVLSFAGFPPGTWTAADRDRVLDSLRKFHLTAEDPGLHSALEWLLGQSPWNQKAWLRTEQDNTARNRAEVEKCLAYFTQRRTSATSTGELRPRWFNSSTGQSLVVLPGPVDFLMGSPADEPGRFKYELQHRMHIDRTFAIASKAVTVEQFRRFRPDHEFTERYAPDPDCPVVSLSWRDAAAFCNWLSEQEGIDPAEWCFTMDASGKEVTGMKENYLSLKGYRLPTEAEMEYAARALTTTIRYFGDTDELLPSYTWFTENCGDRTRPVGSKIPNDFGMFDVYGNVWNWCQDALIKVDRPTVDDGKNQSLTVNPTENRVIRGGSFMHRPWNLRSANFDWQVPTHKNLCIGFRVARTIHAP